MANSTISIKDNTFHLIHAMAHQVSMIGHIMFINVGIVQ